jgi:hypothetical protein
MNRRQERLIRACTELSLQLVLDFAVTLKSGRVITSTALLPELGARKGMVIIDSYSKVADVKDQLVAEGYGFSVLDEPRDQEFDLQSHEEMFADWGWSIRDRPEPPWMAAARKRIELEQLEAEKY